MNISEMTPLERGEEIHRRDGKEINRLLKEAIPRAMRSQATQERKYIRIVEISRQVMDMIEPFTPCRRGCSHCCNMAVSLSDHEAKLIAKYTGRTPLVPKHSIPTDEERDAILLATGNDTKKAAEMWNATRFVARYTGVPCTFLKMGECSIYNVRPLACRIHHVIERDNSTCDVSNKQASAAIDLHEFDDAMGKMYDQGAPWGDIREFFPDDDR